MAEKKLTHCRRCDSTQFLVHEEYVWQADIMERSSVDCYKPTSRITRITYVHCAAEHLPYQFADFNFA